MCPPSKQLRGRLHQPTLGGGQWATMRGGPLQNGGFCCPHQLSDAGMHAIEKEHLGHVEGCYGKKAKQGNAPYRLYEMVSPICIDLPCGTYPLLLAVVGQTIGTLDMVSQPHASSHNFRARQEGQFDGIQESGIWKKRKSLGFNKYC